MPAILATAYASLVGSSGPVSRYSSLIGCGQLARVDARAAEIEQLLHAVHVGRVHHGRVDQHVVVDELGRARRVRHDAADRAGGEHDVLRPVRAEPVVHRRLVAQVELIAAGGQHVAEASRLEAAHERRPDEAAMPGDEDASGLVHSSCSGSAAQTALASDLRPQQALHAIDDASFARCRAHRPA